MKFLLLSIILFVGKLTYAQHPRRIIIPAGSAFSDVITPSIEFLNPDFKQGLVTFKDNSVNGARLNYNMLTREIMFIDPSGDTLAIGREQMLLIKRVMIDTNSFVYDKGYLQIVAENKQGVLVKNTRYVIVSKEKIGGYGMGSPTSSIDSYNRFDDGRNITHSLTVRENITLQLKTDYYMGNPFHLYLPANPKNLEKLFFKNREKLKMYLEQHQVNFTNETDLLQLFTFITNPGL